MAWVEASQRLGRLTGNITNTIILSRYLHWSLPEAPTKEARARQRAFLSFLETCPNVKTQTYSTSKAPTVDASALDAEDVESYFDTSLGQIDVCDDFKQFSSVPAKELLDSAKELLLPEIDFATPNIATYEHLNHLQAKWKPSRAQTFLNYLAIVTGEAITASLRRKHEKAPSTTFAVPIAYELLTAVGCGNDGLCIAINTQRDRENRFLLPIITQRKDKKVKRLTLVAKPDLVVWHRAPTNCRESRQLQVLLPNLVAARVMKLHV